MDVSDFDTNFSSTNGSNIKFLSQRLNQYGDQGLHFNLVRIDWILDEGPYNYPGEVTAEDLTKIFQDVIDLITNSMNVIKLDEDNQNTLINFFNNGRLDKLMSILVIDSLFKNVHIDQTTTEQIIGLNILLSTAKYFIEFIYEFASTSHYNLTIGCSHTISVLQYVSDIQSNIEEEYFKEASCLFNELEESSFDGNVFRSLSIEIFKNCYPCSEIFNYLNYRIQFYHNDNNDIIYDYVDQLYFLTKNLQTQSQISANIYHGLDIYKEILKSSILTLSKTSQISESAYGTNFNQLILIFNEIYDEDLILSQIIPNKTIIKNSDAEDDYGTSNYKYYLASEIDKRKPEWVDLYYKTTYTDSNVMNTNEEEIEHTEEVEDENIENCQSSILVPKFGFRYKLKGYLGLDISTRGNWHSFFRKFKLTR
ncbi:hypothetical protein DFJ63DRAFT_138787 [Scheffersomyces coipomensis]|uniref:uncharacterized protein n=1 Tax=Scheffersomyces coipomensis TaxID=1788519 RepID=UPI00315CC9E6